MGMFDWVKYEMPCPNCGQLLKEFQSKDAGCFLEHLEFWEVLSFYDLCKRCGAWVTFNRILKPVPIEEYKMDITLKKEMEKP